MPRRQRRIRNSAPALSDCVLVNGLSSTMPGTSSGAFAAAQAGAGHPVPPCASSGAGNRQACRMSPVPGDKG